MKFTIKSYVQRYFQNLTNCLLLLELSKDLRSKVSPFSDLLKFFPPCVHSHIRIVEWPTSNPISHPPLQPTYVANVFPMFFYNPIAHKFSHLCCQCFPNVFVQNPIAHEFSPGGVSGCKFGSFQIPGCFNRSNIAPGRETDNDNSLNIKVAISNIASVKSFTKAKINFSP